MLPAALSYLGLGGIDCQIHEFTIDQPLHFILQNCQSSNFNKQQKHYEVLYIKMIENLMVN